MVFLLVMFTAAAFLNGATDAANSVTGAVSSGVMRPLPACALAAAAQTAGGAVFSMAFPAVTDSVSRLAALPENGDVRLRVCAVTLLTVALWASAAWAAGLPTSESHGLMAALSGCAAASGGSIDKHSWLVVALGLVLSVAGGALALPALRLFSPAGKNICLQSRFCIGCLCASAFLHGAQDGQKFVSLAVMCNITDSRFAAVAVCVAAMAAGTLCGGGRIVRKMGREMTDTDLYTSCCADAGSAAALSVLTVFGVPVSTTHVRMSALTFAAAGKGKRIDRKVLLSLAAAWVTTFPVCFFLAKYLWIGWDFIVNCA